MLKNSAKSEQFLPLGVKGLCINIKYVCMLGPTLCSPYSLLYACIRTVHDVFHVNEYSGVVNGGG
jgi:hypothetical protein